MPMFDRATRDPAAETERVRAIWERQASVYDRQMRFWERVLFTGGRRWVCSRLERVVARKPQR